MYTHRTRAAGILLNASNELLAVYHKHPQTGYQWITPPGGKVQDGETIFDTVRREMLEECNLVCVPDRILYVGEWLDPKSLIHHFEIYVAVTYVSGNLKTGYDPEETVQMIQESMFVKQTQFQATPVPVYPAILRDRFWVDAKNQFRNHQIYLGREEQV